MNLKNLRSKRGLFLEIGMIGMFILGSSMVGFLLYKAWTLDENYSKNNAPQLSKKEQLLLEQILHENDPEVIHQLRKVIAKNKPEVSSKSPRSGSKDNCPASFN